MYWRLVATVCRFRKGQIIKRQINSRERVAINARFLTCLYYVVPIDPRLNHNYGSPVSRTLKDINKKSAKDNENRNPNRQSGIKLRGSLSVPPHRPFMPRHRQTIGFFRHNCWWHHISEVEQPRFKKTSKKKKHLPPIRHWLFHRK